MNVLEKILEEISKVEKEYVTGHKVLYALGATGMATEISGIIRSHMNEVPNCGECNRRKWYQISEYGFGFWHDIYDSTSLGFVDTVFKTNDELGYEKVVAWQPLPEPYKEE